MHYFNILYILLYVLYTFYILHIFVCMCKANMAKCWQLVSLDRRHIHCIIFEIILRCEIFQTKKLGKEEFLF